MPYEKKISRAEPGLVVMLLDDSGSMADNLPGTSDRKYLWNERYFGYVAKELLSRSTEMSGDQIRVKPRYFMTIYIYGSVPQLWKGEAMDIQSCVEAYTQAGNSLGLGGKLGGTDAAAALQKAYEHLQTAVNDKRFADSSPPVALHLTDGMSHTDPQPVAAKLKQLSTTDGNVLVANGYIGTETSLNYRTPEDFPGYVDASEAGPSEDNLCLFEMSSPVPESMRANLVEDGIFPRLREGSRLFFDVRTKAMLKHVFAVVGSLGSRADRLAK